MGTHTISMISNLSASRSQSMAFAQLNTSMAARTLDISPASYP
jgi:hypothetical protein